MVILWHVGLTVTSIDKSLAFYRDVAGMRQFEDDRPGLKDLTSQGFRNLTNNPYAAIRMVWLQSGGCTLQLIEYSAGSGQPLELQHNKPGNPHFCFYVNDVDAKYKELKSLGGIRITSEINQVAPTIRSFYVADPDGVPVEFLERDDA